MSDEYVQRQVQLGKINKAKEMEEYYSIMK